MAARRCCSAPGRSPIIPLAITDSEHLFIMICPVFVVVYYLNWVSGLIHRWCADCAWNLDQATPCRCEGRYRANWIHTTDGNRITNLAHKLKVDTLFQRTPYHWYCPCEEPDRPIAA